MPARTDVPSTVARSDRKAQRTWAKSHESAIETYGRGEAAQRVAYAALKHTYEKVGDHWEPKGHKGPSDDRSADPDARWKRGGTPTGGVDVRGHTKQELMHRAREIDLKGRSSMNKEQLAEGIKKANDRETARARGN